MANIAFIGLGNMGLPMAKNLIEKGHSVKGFDLVPSLVETLCNMGGEGADSASNCVAMAETIITMLPEGKNVEEVYSGSIFQSAKELSLIHI